MKSFLRDSGAPFTRVCPLVILAKGRHAEDTSIYVTQVNDISVPLEGPRVCSLGDSVAWRALDSREATSLQLWLCELSGAFPEGGAPLASLRLPDALGQCEHGRGEPAQEAGGVPGSPPCHRDGNT